MQAVFVNIPCPTKEEAIKLCTYLVDQDLCATAKIHENVHLLYKHTAEVEGDDIVLMTLKTTDENIPKIHKYIFEKHSWGQPCIEVVAILNDMC